MKTQPLISVRVDFAAASQAGRTVDRAAAMGNSEVMRQAISAGLLELSFVAQKERFTGAGPFPVAEKRLGVDTGRLRRDLHAEPAEMVSSGYRGRIGSVVEYFGAHELGFDGSVDVPAHTRDRRTVKRKAKTFTRKGKQVSIRANQFSLLEQSVRAHKKRMKIPRREPLATAIREHSVRIMGEAMQKGADQILKGGAA